MVFFSKPTAGTGAACDADDDTSTSEIIATEVSGSHVLTIDGYSCTAKVGRNEYVRSSSFAAAGHRWYLQYPKGYSSGNNDVSDYVSIFLSCDIDVAARCTLSVLDKDGRPAHSCNIVGSKKTYSRLAKNTPQAIPRFIKRKALQKSGHLRDDRVRIRCDITVLKLVLKGDAAATAVAKSFVDVPPSDIVQNLGCLLSSGDGADVMFEVGGETFRAHRSILAARSPVFKGQLFSPVMKEGTATCSVLVVQNMEPRVFKALLHFLYNDVLPEIEEGLTMMMAMHLLVAADTYCLERLKLICEEKLCGYIDTSRVGTMLELAERHVCHGLKKACLSFLMSGGNLMAAIGTGGLEHVMSSCPSVVKELLKKSCS